MANAELITALELLEKERGVSRESILDALKLSLITACMRTYGVAEKKYENLTAEVDTQEGDFHVYAAKTVVDQVEDALEQISLADAQAIDGGLKLGDVVTVEVDSRNFSRIASTNSKGIIVQRIREEESRSLSEEYSKLQGSLVTGVVQRFIGRNMSVNLGRADGFLPENEQIRGERYQIGDRIRVFIEKVAAQNRGVRIRVSRTHPDFVRCLFEEEVAEIRDGIVEIVAVAREAGSRTKMAVYSNDEDVDPVGACVGVNGARVNAVVDELYNEKIDIVEWDEDPTVFIENALSPAKVVAVAADPDERTAKVVVPDYQLSLAIGREGQNARLAAHLTGYKIDIKSETQSQEAEGWLDLDYDDDYDEYDYYDENGNYIGEDAFDEIYYDEDGDYLGEEVYDEAYDDEAGNPLDGEDGGAMDDDEGDETAPDEE